jgi:GntR family transcriptional regulator
MDLDSFRPDDTSPVPLWYQIRNAMLSRIISGVWQPGGQLPAETELRDQLGVSRSTVRNAIDSLVRDGLVSRTRGKGSFVTGAPAAQVKFSPLGFYRTMSARAHTVHSRVLESRVIDPTIGMVRDLGLRKGAKVLHINRLRYLDGRPSVLSSNYLVYDLFRGIEREDLTTGSLWARLEERAGRQVAGGMHTFHAVLATDEEQRLLEIPPTVPLLMSTGTNYLTDGTAFEKSEVRVPGDRGLLEVRYLTRGVTFPEVVGSRS